MKSPVGTPLSLMVSVCALFALLLVGGCKSEEKGRTASLPPPLVGVMTVEERNVPVSFTYAGQTEGSRAVEVRAQVSGILMRRAYNEGSMSSRGNCCSRSSRIPTGRRSVRPKASWSRRRPGSRRPART